MRPAELALVAAIRADLASGAAARGRREAGARQSDVAAVLGVSRQAVSKWEAGICSPSAPHALAYGRLLRTLGKKAA
jgi:DNA-binding XRE family transcriptional regulator